MPKKIFILLCTIGIISVLFTFIQKTPTPPCLNADEAAFSYNAYSLLKTGKDEYGSILPLRLKSFGDYKMPLYTYLSVPFIALLGLNELGARSLNITLSLLLPFAVFFLTRELFKNNKVGIVASFLTSVSLGLHIIARHAHEAYLAAFLTTCASYFFLKILHKKSFWHISLFTLSSIMLLFSYHPGRLFVLFFLLYAIFYLLFEKQKKWQIVIVIVGVLAFFSLTDLAYKPERLKNLAFFNNAGFTLKINELKLEGGIKYLYNPVFIGIKDTLLSHLTYYSPQFLLINGDDNYRFGYPGMSVFTPIEYLLVFIGIYFLFKNKEKWRYFILSILFISPLSASLSWSTGSLTRGLFLFIPLFVLASYGFIQLSNMFRQKHIFYLLFSTVFLFFLIFNWDFYLFHYPKRLTTIHAWQCGYKEVNTFIKNNYQKYDSFYITKDIGQPYIFTLFYLQYLPEKYQTQAQLTTPDEYGFGQVEKFDKFIFDFKDPTSVGKRSVVIGSVDNFKGIKNITFAQLQTISVNGEPMFQIYSPD